MDGILVCCKPYGITSRDLVNQVSRIVRPDKVGHAGTLDPLASGVLVLVVGAASRLVPYIHQYSKTYVAKFELGRSSPSGDLEEEVVYEANPIIPSLEELRLAANNLTGFIQQTPPAHSAIKVGGKPAYKAARQGKPVEIAARTVRIDRLEIIDYQHPTLTALIECSTGTYIRTLGIDWAALVGTKAVMSSLQRTAVGPYLLTNALENLPSTGEELAPHLAPLKTAVACLPRIDLSDNELQDVVHGRTIRQSSCVEASANYLQTTEWAAFDSQDNFRAILVERDQGLGPKKVFPVTALDESTATPAS